MIWALLLLELMIAFGGIVYTISIGYGILFGAPYVGTNKRVARAMLQFAGANEKDVVLDLGCGMGNILRVAQEEFGVTRVIGYEVNPLLALGARLRTGGDIKARPLESLEKQSDVTLVTLYLLTPLMKKVLPLLVQNIPKNARIVSHGFAFPGTNSIKEIHIHNATLRLYAMSDVIAHDYERGSRT